MRLPSTSNRFQSTASIKQSVGDCVSGTGRSRLPAAVLGPCSSPGRQERQREQLAKDCRGVLGRFRAELEERLRWERVSLGKAHSEAVREIERNEGEAYRSGMEGSKERALAASQTDGRSLRYGHPPVDWYKLTRLVLEERMEQVREIDGEQAYEKMRRAVEKASQPVRTSQFPSRKGPERDFGPSR